ncbi:GAF domain-containing protein [Pasteurella skyensis]|uniref:GAF domain-containing protein n=1 Tax=Phocoenobacter skyensis TaxID=97481 RepID=A0AAJ6N9Z4_9PAST|nr:GAF domain-containing protein [Pasteurella skyensis]MDP8162905.1 GAF domain-containing protein [Pasteurella skyensis]MDP8172943.1 GAF domain-containing protein [Pasteurella skyensis]MDP8176610.1 GAF domain-containing protein [Pasteurella skyensis]MDP8179443.1 GAF domain-containing protein [Pasteurella skyensis]MDP8183515.1 GAF domain-containing protein [Pasteurella skyensis]
MNIKQLEAILGDEEDIISRMANISAFLYETVPNINWVGFYIVRGDVLKVGPFQGKVACSTIAKGRGVCGTAWERLETIVVPDTHQFEGHIACDVASRSEVVIPILDEKGEMYAELDVDSPLLNRFSDEDVAFLTDCAALVFKR